jgi:hypothetical protein
MAAATGAQQAASVAPLSPEIQEALSGEPQAAPTEEPPVELAEPTPAAETEEPVAEEESVTELPPLDITE